ncbi:MAG: DUF3616 domain-containing protein [Verrucomicrobia bacterium]|nr:DUF3616 domain-containing protein [Verrucomicrobiota bacterium]
MAVWIAGAAGAQPRVGAPVVYHGMCDASAGVAVSTNLFLAADDEGNLLRLFRTDQGGEAVQRHDLSGFLALAGEHPEADFEGAAPLGGRIFWIGSHGRNRDGKYRENRHRFFATEVRRGGDMVQVAPVGRCYRELLAALLFDSRLRVFNLAAASSRPPKSKGGFNIEGLCATREHHLLIGFRNPIPGGRALLVPLLNPEEVIRGLPPRLGPPKLLDLGGLGVRDLAFCDGEIFILAGAHNADHKFALYRWSGDDTPPRKIHPLAFKGLTPEALVFYPGRVSFQVLSDDGTRPVDGTRCKDLPDPARKRFRGVWVHP